MLKNYLAISKHVDSIKTSIIFFICGITAIFSQQSPVLLSSVDTTTIKIGEQINYQIKINSDSISNIVFEKNQIFNPFEVIEEFEIDTFKKSGRTSFIKKFSITSFDDGVQILKPKKILVDDVLYYSDSILINVLNIKVDTVSKKFFDIKNITEIQKNNDGWWKKYLFGFLVLVALFIAYKLYRKFSILKLENEKPPLPIDKAIIALQRLESKDLKEQLDYKEYYSKLTEIVKNYLEEDISLDALESTTDELINKLELLKDAGKLSLSKETIQNFKSVLKTADLVKFAKSNPGLEIAFSDKKLLKTVLLDTKDAIPKPTEEELLKSKVYAEKQKNEKRKKVIKNIIIVLFTFIFSALVISTYLYGWKSVSDTVLGNSTKSLLNKSWIQGNYGAHPIIISTPDVLKRIKIKDSNQNFEWESLDKSISIFLTIESDDKKIEQENVQSVIDELIIELKENGATNILTKQEEIFLEKGAPAFKIFGSFDYIDSKDIEKRNEYVYLKFQENQGKQSVLVIFERENAFAKEIAKKIEKSIIFKIE